MKRLILFIVFAALLITGCGKKPHKETPFDIKKPRAWGHRQTIYIFADDRVWETIKSSLKKGLEQTYFTTQEESWFIIKRADIANIDQFYKFNNLLFIGNINSGSKVADYLNVKLHQNILAEVKDSNGKLFSKSNLWADDQSTVFMLANSDAEAENFVISNTQKAFNVFKQKFKDRIRAHVYSSEIYPEKVFKNRPWTLELPKKYTPFKSDLKNGFISYLARIGDNPDRFIAVYYQKIPKMPLLDWVKATRAKIGEKYYEGDEFNDKTTFWTEHKINNTNAIKFYGKWENHKHIVGGAFSSYGFYDKTTGYAYLIDTTVYYPSGDKLKPLVELELISETFKSKLSE